LLLTAIGLYGTISYSVAQRTREIGTRMALGAQQVNILKLVVSQGMVLAIMGVTLGVAGALLAARAIESMLFEVGPSDPMTLLGVTAIVFLVAMLATIVPAWRAAAIDPLEALRYE
jgi:putative ABC transport system permease protein